MKQNIFFECQKCGARYPRWQGQCSACGEWNTLEQVAVSAKLSARGGSALGGKTQKLNPKKLKDLKELKTERIKLGIGEWDNALGGGMVPGQVILLAGEPGVGKSTLLLKIAEKLPVSLRGSGAAGAEAISSEIATPRSPSGLAMTEGSSNTLYFAGEESLSQIRQRASRLKLDLDHVSFVEAEADVDSLLDLLESSKADFLLVDSIQTLVDLNIGSPSGSLAQVRECAQKITTAAKRLSVPVIMVGHINKEGNVAGPKVLEHIVDSNLFLEGEKFQALRILRVLKNRFGPVDEVGLFEMKDTGLEEAQNPGALFIAERQGTASGSALAVVMEGTRPVLVEVQALTLPCKFGYPKRSANGVNLNRLQTLLAVIEKRLSLSLQDKDVYVSLAGGIKVSEPALDLPLCLAIISAIKDVALPKDLAAFGEVGLGGEIRQVIRQEQREKQAKKLGMRSLVSNATHKSLNAILGLFYGKRKTIIS